MFRKKNSVVIDNDTFKTIQETQDTILFQLEKTMKHHASEDQVDRALVTINLMRLIEDTEDSISYLEKLSNLKK